MFCSNCGKPVQPDVKFCSSCGASVGGDAQVSAPAAPIAQPQPRPARPAVSEEVYSERRGFMGWLRGLKTWKKVVLGIVVFIFAVIGLAMWGTSGLDKPVEQHFASLKAGDVIGAYSQLSVAARAATSLDDFKAMLKNMPALTQVTGTSFTSRTVENGQGKLEGTLELEGGGKLPIEVNLVKENGEWKILAYHAKQVKSGE